MSVDVFDLDIEVVLHPLNVFFDLSMLDRLSRSLATTARRPTACSALGQRPPTPPPTVTYAPLVKTILRLPIDCSSLSSWLACTSLVTA